MTPLHPYLAFTLGDMSEVAKRHWLRLLLGALFFGGLLSYNTLMTPPLYLAKASYREKDRGSSSTMPSVSKMLGLGSGSSPESEAMSVMNSELILAPLSDEEHLQGQITELTGGSRRLKLFRDNLRLQAAYILRKQTPVLPDPMNSLLFSQLVYGGEEILSFTASFLDDHTFVLKDGKGSPLGTYSLGTAVEGGSYAFSLEGAPGMPLAGKTFALTLCPKPLIISGLKSRLRIKPNEDDRTLLQLEFTHPNRRFSAHFLNRLMEHYQAHLEAENNRHASFQLAYLTRRQEETTRSLEAAMRHHAKANSQNASRSQIADTEKEMDFLALSQKELRQRLREIQLEQDRISKALKHPDAPYEHYSFQDISGQYVSGVALVRSLKNKRETLQAALDRAAPHPPLDEHAFPGLDLDAAHKLYLQLQQTLNDLEATEKHYAFMERELAADPSCPVDSLMANCSDPLIQRLIPSSLDNHFALQDEAHRSEKERERLKSQNVTTREILADHFLRNTHWHSLKQDLVQEKILALLNASLNLVNREIHIQENFLSNFLQNRQRDLEHQGTLLTQAIDKIGQTMADLPDLWVSEQLVKQQVSQAQRVMEEVTRLVESKNIAHNLEVVQSRPLDIASPPPLACSPHLPLFCGTGLAMGALLAWCLSLWSSLTQGLIATPSNIGRLLPFNAGSFSRKFARHHILSIEDEATLRRLAQQLTQSKTTSFGAFCPLLLHQGPDYSQELASLLANQGAKVLIMSLNFAAEPPTESPQGLVPYLLGKASHAKVQKMGGYDYLPAGGQTPHGPELMRSSRMEELLESYREKYEWILGVSPTSPLSAEGEGLALMGDEVVLSLGEERLPQLEFHRRLAEEKPLLSVFFVP